MWRPSLLSALLLAGVLACSGGSAPRLPDGGTGVTTLPDGGPGVNPSLDSDGDGLPDVVEDANGNGKVDPGETDPHKLDTDCDGLIDGPDNAAKGWKGEDQNADGKVDPGETDPRQADTDADGLVDGVEKGVATAPDATCTAYTGDSDPTTTTDPTHPDSDGDGILDGTEDGNHNGQVDPGETNPTDSSDANTPAGEACAADKLRPVTFVGSNGGRLRVGLPGNFQEVVPVMVGGAERGLIGYDAADQVAFLAFTETPPGSDATADEAALESKFALVGAISNRTTQTFTTWDGYGALRAFYTQGGSVDLKARIDALAEQLVGAGAGALTGSAGVNGPFQVEVEYAHRSAQELAVVVAIAPSSKYSAESTFFAVGDSAGGSALANFTDSDNVQCESFTSHPAKVDFLFVVDDSGSMANHQNALASAANEVAAKLNNAYLDWRVAMVTTYYHHTTGSTNPNTSVIRGFTRDIEQFKSWLLQNSTCDTTTNTCSLPSSTPTCNSSGGANGGCWVDSTGAGDEGSLGAARKALDDMSPATDTEQMHAIRKGAQVVVVLLGDADDQTSAYTADDGDCINGCEDVQHFVDYFGNTGKGTAANHAVNPFGIKISVNGIVCPTAATSTAKNGAPYSCGEYNPSPQRNATVITSTGGIRGDITTDTGITTAVDRIVDDAINSAGHTLTKPPIGASIKVVLDGVIDNGTCPKASATDTFFSIPRSRANGFDFDGLTGKLSFFGGCRPQVPDVTRAAVSYRYWIPGDSCPADCGGCPTGSTCNLTTCSCVTVN